MDEAFSYAQKCTEFPDTREDGKAWLKEITSKKTEEMLHARPTPGASGGSPTQPQNGHRDLERVLRENNGSFASPHEDSAAETRDLEPMNLTFSPN